MSPSVNCSLLKLNFLNETLEFECLKVKKMKKKRWEKERKTNKTYRINYRTFAILIYSSLKQFDDFLYLGPKYVQAILTSVGHLGWIWKKKNNWTVQLLYIFLYIIQLQIAYHCGFTWYNKINCSIAIGLILSMKSSNCVPRWFQLHEMLSLYSQALYCGDSNRLTLYYIDFW